MNRRAVAIGAGAALVVLVLWYFLLWSPRNDDLEAAKERRETAETQQSQLRTEIARLRAAQKDEPLLRAQLETLRTSVPDEPNLAQFILDANDAAIRSGIDFISIAPSLPAPPAAPVATTPPPGGTTPGAPATPTPAGALPADIRLSLQIRGGYFQVLDFLNRLDALPRLVVTDGLNISSEATTSPRLTVAVTARMFVRAVPASFGGPAAATTTTAPPAGAATTATTAAGGDGATATSAPGAATTTTTTGTQP
ncbi:MAG: type II secretion system protein GspM [Actinomycetota bacterium]|nr:type II secretion system protein GspM [Actinomycetota bacterium]